MAKLPQGWVVCQIKDIGDIVAGGTPSTQNADNFGGNIAWITPADLSDYKEKFISYGKRNITEKGLKNSSARLMPKGSVLFSSRAPIGYTVIAANPICTNQGFKNIVPSKQVFNEYIYYYLKSSKTLIENFASGTTFKEISGTKFGLIPFPLPPLNEQKRIVEKIESEFAKIDEGLEHLEQAKEQIKQYRQSVLKSAFEGKLTQQNPDDEPAEILLQKINPKANFNYNNKLPQGWVECQLGEVFNIVNGDRGKNYPAKNKLHTSGIPFVSAINIQNSELFIENLLYLNEQQYDLLRSGKITKGDSLLCIRGSIGKHCIYPFDTGAIASSMVIIRKSLPNMNKFLFYYLESFCFKQEVKKYDNGTAQPNLSASDLKRFNYLLPPLNEQKRIVEEIEKRFAVADEVQKVVEQNIEKVKQLKQSILKKAFEGRLVPQDPTDEPASKLLEKIKQERNKNDRK